MDRSSRDENRKEFEYLGDIPGLFRRFNLSDKKGNYELYAMEFAYSVIFGNLKQANIPIILELLELKVFPNVMLLLRVDSSGDYQPFPEFSRFPLKDGIVRKVRECLQSAGLEGVVANYLGRDFVGAFLCLNEEAAAQPERLEQVLAGLSKTIISRVGETQDVSVSIGISRLCAIPSRFTQGFAECKKALSENFRQGKGNVFFAAKQAVEEEKLDKAELDRYFLVLEACIYQSDPDGCKRIVARMMELLGRKSAGAVRIKLYMTSYINHLNESLADARLDQAVAEEICLKAIQQILNSRFIEDVSAVLLDLCGRLCTLAAGAQQDSDGAIKLCIDNCIAKMYAKSNFNLEAAARLTHYSTYHFGRVFTRIYGESFTRYLSEYRVGQAKKLLMLKHLSLNDVAIQAGFSSVSYFCTVFKNATSLSPSQYRQVEPGRTARPK